MARADSRELELVGHFKKKILVDFFSDEDIFAAYTGNGRSTGTGTGTF